MISLGIENVTAFLPLDKAHENPADAPLERGCNRWLIIHTISRSGAHTTLTLSAEGSRVQNASLSAQSALGIAQLLPGTLVKVTP